MKNIAIAIFAFLGFFIPFLVGAQHLVPSSVGVQSFASLNNSTLVFRENKGQLMDENHKALADISFYGKQGGVNIYCMHDKIAFVFVKLSGTRLQGLKDKGKILSRDAMHGVSTKKPTLSSTRLEMTFTNANPSATITPSEQQTYYENYYTTGDANHGITNVRTYNTITYQNIYPHIDLILKAGNKSLEYSFLVHPGGNVADIQIEWKGTDSIKDLENGGIEYQIPGMGASLRETAPITYQPTVGVQNLEPSPGRAQNVEPLQTQQSTIASAPRAF